MPWVEEERDGSLPSLDPMSMHVNNLIVDASTTVPTISTKVAVTSCGCGG